MILKVALYHFEDRHEFVAVYLIGSNPTSQTQGFINKSHASFFFKRTVAVLNSCHDRMSIKPAVTFLRFLIGYLYCLFPAKHKMLPEM